MQADGVEFISDVIEKEQELIDFAFLSRTDINQDDIDKVIKSSHKVADTYNKKYSGLFKCYTNNFEKIILIQGKLKLYIKLG